MANEPTTETEESPCPLCQHPVWKHKEEEKESTVLHQSLTRTIHTHTRNRRGADSD
jgi:hypothetical protein